MEKLLLSPEEAAEVLGVGRSRVYDLMRTRQLTSVRIGKSRRVPVAAVHAYVARLHAQEQAAWQRLRQVAVAVTATTYTLPSPKTYDAVLQTVQPPEAPLALDVLGHVLLNTF